MHIAGSHTSTRHLEYMDSLGQRRPKPHISRWFHAIASRLTIVSPKGWLVIQITPPQKKTKHSQLHSPLYNKQHRMSSGTPNTSQSAATQAWQDFLRGDTQRAAAWAQSVLPTTNNVDTLWIAAKIFSQTGQLELARSFFELILVRSPENPEVQYGLACCQAELGQAQKALKSFRLSGHENNPLACVAFASSLASGGSQLAALDFLTELPPSIKTAPPVAIRHSALKLECGDAPGARELLKSCIEAGIEEPKLLAKASFNLGVLLEEAQPLEAESAYKAAISANPEYLKAWLNLAVLLANRSQAHEQALSLLGEAQVRFPDSIPLMYLTAYLHRLSGNFEAAVLQLQRLVSITNDHPEGWELLGRCLFALGRIDEAQKHYERWLSKHPENPIATHLLAALVGEAAPSRASAAYVSNTFDAFADTFDQTLAKLDYQGPKLFEDLLNKHYEGNTGQKYRALDAGCGTGLLGNILRPYASHLIGVDLSSAMLQHASNTGAYDELICDDLEDFLERENEPFELIVASDTFNYFGDLGKLLRLSIAALKPGGILAFSVEQGPLSDDCFQLMPHGRYIHSPHYLVWLLGEQGITGGTMCKVVLRKEEEAAVNALLIIAKRPLNEQSDEAHENDAPKQSPAD